MEPSLAAFVGTRLIASGPQTSVLALARALSPEEGGSVVFFELATGKQTDFDLHAPPRTGPGRPKLGVVSTEVTLLPRHWEWLNSQPGRASGTLRRLVEAAMAAQAVSPQARLDALGRVLWAVAGNEPGFEEASRALYAGDRARLNALAAAWSGDLPEFVSSWE